jgi:GT2 family glycosyltransferase
MKLTLLLVNHNLSDKLCSAINALTNAAKGINYELIVVDNGSTDGSANLVAKTYPEVRLIVNEQMVGQSKAANQGLKAARGEYILLVSADTIANSDSLFKVLNFMDLHLNAGGLSIRLITPMGKFITASKHALSKPWITFFKLSGLYKYFQKSRLANHKPADWIEEFETTEIDILNGSCMLLRKSALNKAGLFDERFVNYGYNIDLSYRMRLAGYKNYYFANTYLIRVAKNEINKFSWTYISQYYGAMFIFAGKYLFKMPVIRIKTIGEQFQSSYEIKG